MARPHSRQRVQQELRDLAGELQQGMERCLTRWAAHQRYHGNSTPPLLPRRVLSDVGNLVGAFPQRCNVGKDAGKKAAGLEGRPVQVRALSAKQAGPADC